MFPTEWTCNDSLDVNKWNSERGWRFDVRSLNANIEGQKNLTYRRTTPSVGLYLLRDSLEKTGDYTSVDLL